MLHELNGHDFDNQYHPREPRDSDCALCYTDAAVLLLGGSDAWRLPSVAEVRACVPDAELRYLFEIDGTAYFLVGGVPAEMLPGGEPVPFTVLRTLSPQHVGFAAATGAQLHRFYRDNRFCGRCAAPMAHSDKERAMACPSCGNIVYPKLSPAVIVGVTDGDRLLLTKYAGRAYARYALVAGYCEFGEAAERTVEREVLEEVGLRVTNIRYVASQPWPFSDTLLMGFFCDLAGAADIALDEAELSEARWFLRHELPDTENTASLTNTLIEAFRAGRDR